MGKFKNASAVSSTFMMFSRQFQELSSSLCSSNMFLYFSILFLSSLRMLKCCEKSALQVPKLGTTTFTFLFGVPP